MKQDKLIKDALPVKKTKKDALPVKKTKNYKIKELSQNNLIKNSEYKDELIEERIKKLVEIAKRTIKNRIFDEDKRIASNSEIENIYNIGCDGKHMEYSVLEIAKILIKEIKGTENYEEWIEYIEDRPFNDERYYISNSKLKNLGWKITKYFENEIKKII